MSRNTYQGFGFFEIYNSFLDRENGKPPARKAEQEVILIPRYIFFGVL